MKALLSKAPGEPESLVLEEMANPAPEAGEVVIAVKACGVNYPDVLIIKDEYQFKPPRPFSPGGEIAGIVDVAAEDVTEFNPGDGVIGVGGGGGRGERGDPPARRCVR